MRGVRGVFDYLRDLHDDPRPSFALKLVLAGPSMAGKTSLLNALRLREARLTDADSGRTIGLDIERLTLHDPRAPGGLRLLCYDAGGHDEYQEMQQVFVTQNTLYLLLWNVAKQPAEGQDVRSFERERVAQQVRWAQIIQSCAPGSTVRSSSAPPCFHTLSCAVLFRLCAVLSVLWFFLLFVFFFLSFFQFLLLAFLLNLHAVESSFPVLCYLSRSLRVTVFAVCIGYARARVLCNDAC